MPPLGGWRGGVYRIRNKIDGKVYVGSAANCIKQRWGNHRTMLRGGYHHNVHLQNAWDREGERSFAFEVVERCPPEKCVEREQHWIDSERAAEPQFGYNHLPRAGSRLGTPSSEETKNRIRASKLGKPLSPETKAKMSRVRKGKAPISAILANTGRRRVFTEEHKRNIARAARHRR